MAHSFRPGTMIHTVPLLYSVFARATYTWHSSTIHIITHYCQIVNTKTNLFISIFLLTKRKIYDIISVQKERRINMDFEVVFWIVVLIGAVVGVLWMINAGKHENYVSHETIARIENGGRHL